MPSLNHQTSIQNVRAGHDVNGQIVNPVPVDFNLPLTIQNAEDPEQQTPIAIHVIVDNASEFPAGGGGGGDNMKTVNLTYGFANAIESMVADPVTGLALAVWKQPEGDSKSGAATKSADMTPPVCFAVIPPSEYETGTVFMVPADTWLDFQVWDLGFNTMTKDSSLGVIVYDLDTDEDLADVCLPGAIESYTKFNVQDDNLYINSFIVPSSVEHVVVVSIQDQK